MIDVRRERKPPPLVSPFLHLPKAALPANRTLPFANVAEPSGERSLSDCVQIKERYGGGAPLANANRAPGLVDVQSVFF